MRAASGAQRNANSEFLLACLGSHQFQVRDVGAGDQHDDGERAHHHPEHLADIANHFLLQRTNRRRDPPVLVPMRIGSRAIRPGIHPDRHHARDIGVGLRDRDSGLQPAMP